MSEDLASHTISEALDEAVHVGSIKTSPEAVANDESTWVPYDPTIHPDSFREGNVTYTIKARDDGLLRVEGVDMNNPDHKLGYRRAIVEYKDGKYKVSAVRLHGKKELVLGGAAAAAALAGGVVAFQKWRAHEHKAH